jgi:hypothetical protein
VAAALLLGGVGGFVLGTAVDGDDPRPAGFSDGRGGPGAHHGPPPAYRDEE